MPHRARYVLLAHTLWNRSSGTSHQPSSLNAELKRFAAEASDAADWPWQQLTAVTVQFEDLERVDVDHQQAHTDVFQTPVADRFHHEPTLTQPAN